LEVQEVLEEEQLAKELTDKQDQQILVAAAEQAVEVHLLQELEDQVLLLLEELQRVHQELQVVVNLFVVRTLFTYLIHQEHLQRNYGTFCKIR
jgi:hypothetical protein